jgi:hypothetical protein
MGQGDELMPCDERVNLEKELHEARLAVTENKNRDSPSRVGLTPADREYYLTLAELHQTQIENKIELHGAMCTRCVSESAARKV